MVFTLKIDKIIDTIFADDRAVYCSFQKQASYTFSTDTSFFTLKIDK